MSKESDFYITNQLTLAESIIENIQSILDGKEVSDFDLSFGVVREVADLKQGLDYALERIANLQKDIGLMTHDWQCGCAHWNGSNLSICADCGRKPNER
jgi:hypothetical protein